MTLIPTAFRRKISRQLSYPLGAEMFSEALRGIPDFGQLSIWFTVHGTPSKIRAAATRDEPLPVLKASYLDYLRLYGEERWKIEVYPVPREHKATVRQALLDKGLPKVREWLNGLADPDLRRRGSKHCKVAVRPRSGAITVERIDVTAG